MMKLSRNTLMALLLLASAEALALVDMRNANYANTWVDFETPGTGFSLQVSRSYSSRSLHNGIFGFGWCSDLETKLTIRPEGTPTVSECGAGQNVVYAPKDFGSKNVQAAVDQIINKIRTVKKLDERTMKKLRADLQADPALRVQYATELKISTEIKEGEKLYANGIETENLVFAKGVYTRSMSDGSSQRFDRSGRLTHVYDKNGNFVRLEYDKDKVREIIDNNGRRLKLAYYPNGKVKQITGPNNVTMEYKYNEQEDLKFVNNAWGNKLNYDYDDLHNLTKATYPDGTFIALDYDRKNDWVTSFTDRQKCVENYKYEFDEKNPNLHYWSSVKKTCGKDITNESRHEFWYAERPNGEAVLQKVASTVNGVKTEIAYHEVFNRPTSITRGNVTNRYDYYPNGQVKIKESPIGRLVYKYYPGTRKVETVLAETFDDKKKVIRTRTTTYKWDDKGNLKEAFNTDGQRVKLENDQRGRMVRVEDQAKKVITLQYDDEKTSLPNVITRPGFGSLKLSYKTNGDMDKMDSPQGASAALQIVMTLRSYLEITGPANAELYN